MSEAEYDCQESELAPPATFWPALFSPRRALDSTPDVFVDGPPRTSRLTSPGVCSSDASRRSGCAPSPAGTPVLLAHYQGQGRYPKGNRQTRTWTIFEWHDLLSPYSVHTQHHCEGTYAFPVCLSSVCAGFLIPLFPLFLLFFLPLSLVSVFFLCFIPPSSSSLNALRCDSFFFLCLFIAPRLKLPLHYSLSKCLNLCYPRNLRGQNKRSHERTGSVRIFI